MSQTVLTVEGLKVHFPLPKKKLFSKEQSAVKAVDGISFHLDAGETLGIVGESGCGKSTLARAILGLTKITSGKVVWLGQNLAELSQKQMRDKRQEIQVVFQDPLASLNPRMTVGEIIAEPLKTFFPTLPKVQLKERVQGMMKMAGLLPNQINRYPHEFSGGQCQRIGIARALILNPKLVICDEPVSALDVSIQAQIVNLLMDLQKKLDIALIFIAHDLSVVRHISNRVLVMYLGHIMEIAQQDPIYEKPLHPYTQALINAVPIPDPDIERNKEMKFLSGDLPSPSNPPSGCVFCTRCPQVETICREKVPELRKLDNDRFVACHLVK